MKNLRIVLLSVLLLYCANTLAQVELYSLEDNNDKDNCYYTALQVDFTHNRFVYRVYYDYGLIGLATGAYIEFCGIIKENSLSKIFIQHTTIERLDDGVFVPIEYKVPEDLLYMNIENKEEVCIMTNKDMEEFFEILFPVFYDSPNLIFSCMKKSKKNKLNYKKFPKELRKKIKEREKIIYDDRYFEIISRYN